MVVWEAHSSVCNWFLLSANYFLNNLTLPWERKVMPLGIFLHLQVTGGRKKEKEEGGVHRWCSWMLLWVILETNMRSVSGLAQYPFGKSLIFMNIFWTPQGSLILRKSKEKRGKCRTLVFFACSLGGSEALSSASTLSTNWLHPETELFYWWPFSGLNWLCTLEKLLNFCGI